MQGASEIRLPGFWGLGSAAGFHIVALISLKSHTAHH